MNIETIEEMIEQFYEDHPIRFWLLVRLAACVIIMLACIFGLLTIACIILAILALFCMEFGILAICLICLPVLCVCVWAAVTGFSFVFNEFLDM